MCRCANTTMLKTCSKCEVEKEFSEFPKRKSSKDGLACWCRSCFSAYYSKYYKDNKVALCEKARTYHKENREEILPKLRKSYEKHKDKRAKYQTEYRNTPKGTLVARNNCSKRRAAEKAGDVTTSQLEGLLKLHTMLDGTYLCEYCNESGEKYHIDHIKPLCKGGLHTINNLTIACPGCNHSKGSKELVDFLNKS